MLKFYRTWHTWLGLAVSGIVVVVALTGIYMQHKEAFGGGPPAPRDPAALSTASAVGGIGFGAEQALAAARAQWGEVPLRSLELRNTPSGLGWKINAGEGRQLWLSAADGAPMPKDGRTGFDFGKLLERLHTGEVGGLAGVLLVDLMALVLVFLTLSGVWLWLKPVLVRRAKASQPR